MSSHEHNYLWLAFAFMTVASWGLYGIFLHNGQAGMADPVAGRYKAFLFVGIAYFLIAVLAPLGVLVAKGASWAYPVKGMGWSLLAGVVGAIGAFCVLLAFGAKGTPAAVMSIIFAGAPIVNATVAISLHPPAGGLKSISPLFFLPTCPLPAPPSWICHRRAWICACSWRSSRIASSVKPSNARGATRTAPPACSASTEPRSLKSCVGAPWLEPVEHPQALVTWLTVLGSLKRHLTDDLLAQKLCSPSEWPS